VLDGAGWDQADDLKVPDNMRLARLAPYGPELYSVEHLWEEIREKWFPNLTFRELDYVEDVLENALHTREQDSARVASLTGFDWLIFISLKAS
jgi:transposase